MAAGEIVVSLLANTGSFDTDIQRSTKAAERRMKEMKETAAAWGTAVGAAFAGAAAAGVYMSKQLIDGIDALNDVADATGSTVEKISALEDVAERTGTSMDTVTGAMVKFNQSLAKADGKDGVSQALKAIGLEAAALKQMDPADALLTTATALSKFADDGDKARLVQELFGKSVAEVAPLLKDLAEKGQLVATVTTEQAKAAEAFNNQINDLTKNAKDLGRTLVTDLVTAINTAAKAFKESGLLEGFRTLFTGDDQHKNNKRLVELTDQLLRAENAVSAIRAKDFARSGDPSAKSPAQVAAEMRLATLKSELATVQAYQKVLQGGPAALGGAAPAAAPKLPSVGPLPGPKGPKGPDPDADFKSYLNNLQQQVQKTNDLTVAEKLLDDIRRGALSVSPKQQEQLTALAKQVDLLKEVAAEEKVRMEHGREAAIAMGDAVNKANEELQRLRDGGPAAQLEVQRREMQLLADAFLTGAINADQFNDAATGALGLVAEKAPEAKTMTEELGLTFSSAFEEAVLGGGKMSDVFKGLLVDIARVILRMQVMEPMMRQIKESMGGGGGGGGGGLAGIFSSFFGGGGQAAFSNTSMGASGFGTGMAYGNMDFGGFFADGGSPPVGKVSVVGERGPELFVPRTAGAIVPNHAMGGGAPTIINQTTGRVDRAIERRMPDGERILILQEAVEMVAGELSNPTSRIGRSLRGTYNVSRKMA